MRASTFSPFEPLKIETETSSGERELQYFEVIFIDFLTIIFFSFLQFILFL